MLQYDAPDEPEAWLTLLKEVEVKGPLPARLNLRWSWCGSWFLEVRTTTVERDSHEEGPLTTTALLPEIPSVEWVYRVIRSAWIHELGEWFKFKGDRLHDPHTDAQDPLSRLP